MTGYRIMPVEATVEMKLSGARSIGATMNTANHAERANSCWQAMRAAAPRYEIGDAEVERITKVHCSPKFDDCMGPDCACWENQKDRTRAALEAFRDGLEGR